jgi:hypothetical protein
MMKFRREYRRIRLDVSSVDEMMLRQRLEFGLRNLDLAFRLYCWCRENSPNPQDPYEYKRFFVRELERRRVHYCFHIMVSEYCESRLKIPVIRINDEESYDHMISQVKEVSDMKALIRRMKCQKDRLPLSSLKLSTVEYEIHGEYMGKCLDDMIKRLHQLEPDCDPDTDDACVPYNDREPIVRVYNSDEDSDEE